MTAVRLRAAASRLRELAEAAEVATPGPWRSSIEARDHRGGDDVILTGGEDVYVRVHANLHGSHEAQDYIAAMHPGLALALAGWFDSMAEDHDAAPRDVHRLIGVDVGEVELDAGVVAVIDAVLGDRQSASR